MPSIRLVLSRGYHLQLELQKICQSGSDICHYIPVTFRISGSAHFPKFLYIQSNMGRVFCMRSSASTRRKVVSGPCSLLKRKRRRHSILIPVYSPAPVPKQKKKRVLAHHDIIAQVRISQYVFSSSWTDNVTKKSCRSHTS